ncbi:MAG: glycosyltransferase family 87 protein [Pseudomonadota bacterium]|nr:glycosyltransferase family 87 protein [Pseudomonadota bacterium]
MQEAILYRETGWLTRERVNRLSIAAILAYCVGAVVVIATAHGGFDALGIPLGFDFLAFHGAARLAADGELAAGFDPYVFTATLEQQLPGVGYGYFWLYPPTFALMLAPLALLSYGAAFWVWTIAGLSVYGGSVWLATRDKTAVLACLGFTATWVTAYHGQNAFYSAALFIAATSFLLKRKEVLAGIAIGLLAFKPHLAVLFPFALAACSRWRAFGAATATLLVFSSVSIAAFGWEYLEAYVAHGESLASSLLADERHWATISSLYVAAQLAGAPHAAALALHVVVAISVSGFVIARIYNYGATKETLAMLVAASLLVSPYVMDYDLAVLAAAGVLLFGTNDRRHATPMDQSVGLFIAMIPILVVGLGRAGIQIGWIAPALVLMLAEARLRRWDQAPSRRAALGAK